MWRARAIYPICLGYVHSIGTARRLHQHEAAPPRAPRCRRRSGTKWTLARCAGPVPWMRRREIHRANGRQPCSAGCKTRLTVRMVLMCGVKLTTGACAARRVVLLHVVADASTIFGRHSDILAVSKSIMDVLTLASQHTVRTIRAVRSKSYLPKICCLHPQSSPPESFRFSNRRLTRALRSGKLAATIASEI